MKKYSHLIILFFLSLLIVLAGFSIYFLHQKIQNALNAQERTKLEQEIQTNRIKDLPALAHRYQTIVDNEQYFSLVYPENKVVEIIKDMERIAKDHNVVLTITQKEVIKKKAVKKEEAKSEEEGSEAEAPKELADTLPYEKSILLELKAEGRYLALRKFVHALETAPYALDVLAITASVAPPEEDAVSVVQSQTDSPFLLSSTLPETASVPAQNPAKIIFLLDIALYTQ